MHFYRSSLFVLILAGLFLLQGCDLFGTKAGEPKDPGVTINVTVNNPDSIAITMLSIAWGDPASESPDGSHDISSPTFPVTYTITGARKLSSFMISAAGFNGTTLNSLDYAAGDTTGAGPFTATLNLSAYSPSAGASPSLWQKRD